MASARTVLIAFSVAVLGGAIITLTSMAGTSAATSPDAVGRPECDGAGTPAARRAVPPIATYDEELQRLKVRIHALTRRVERTPQSWLALEHLAATYMERARLTGGFTDLAEAERILAGAFDLAGEGAGPFLTRARLHYAVHRFEKASEDLTDAEKRALIPDPMRAEIAGLRADLAFLSGRIPDALRGFQRAIELHPTMPAYFRLGHYFWKTGDFDRAGRILQKGVKLFRAAEAGSPGFFLPAQEIDPTCRYRRAPDWP